MHAYNAELFHRNWYAVLPDVSTASTHLHSALLVLPSICILVNVLTAGATDLQQC